LFPAPIPTIEKEAHRASSSKSTLPIALSGSTGNTRRRYPKGVLHKRNGFCGDGNLLLTNGSRKGRLSFTNKHESPRNQKKKAGKTGPELC
jgi:hypothetical protein